MTPSAFVAAFNSPDAPCPVCGIALGSSMMHDAPECIAVLRRHLSESEARARMAEGAAEMAIKEAGEARDRLAAQIESHRLTIAERDTARADVAIAYCPIAKGVWFWQGYGDDHPESLTCPVVMSAETLRAMLADHIEVTPAMRAAVEAVREARAWPCRADGTDDDVTCGLDTEGGPCDVCFDVLLAEQKLSDLILSALPPVQP